MPLKITLLFLGMLHFTLSSQVVSSVDFHVLNDNMEDSYIELEKFNNAVKYLSKSSELGQEKLVEPWLQYIEYLQKTAS